mgnify:CR=1 FL=1
MPPENEASGLLYGVVSAILFSVMAVASQQLPSSISSSQISTFRGLFTALALLPFVLPHLKKLFDIKATRSIWIRSISGGIAVICYFYNLEFTSAANAKALSNTNPLYVAIFAWFMYREKLSRIELAGLVVLVYGACLLAWNLNLNGSNTQWLVGCVGSFFTAVAYLSLKRASGKFTTPFIVFTFGVAVAIVSAITPGKWAMPNSTEFFWLSVVGAAGLGGQIFLTFSYMNLKNSLAAALTLLQSLMLIAYDLTWSGRLTSGVGLWGNCLILFGMALMVVFRKKTLVVATPVLQAPQSEI